MGDEKLRQSFSTTVSGQGEQHSVQQAQEHGVQRNISVLEHLIDCAEKKNLSFTARPVGEDLQFETADRATQTQSMEVFPCLLSCDSLEAGLKEVFHDVLLVTTQHFRH